MSQPPQQQPFDAAAMQNSWFTDPVAAPPKRCAFRTLGQFKKVSHCDNLALPDKRYCTIHKKWE